MKCPKCRKIIPNGAKICPYCHSEVNGFGIFGDMYDDFKEGYSKGKNEVDNDPMSSIFSALFAGVLVVLFAALYFIQKWTGIPVLDWVESAFEWIWDILWELIKKLINWLNS